MGDLPPPTFVPFLTAHLYFDMKKLLILLFILVLPNFLYSQNEITITGYIFNKENIPISDVNVWVVKTNIGTVSKKNGYFNISFNKNTSTILKFSHLNYKPLLINIDTIIDILHLRIHLEKSVNKIDEITISASNLPKIKNDFQILDYNFINDTLIILSKDIYNKSYKIVLIKNEIDTITKFILPSRYKLTNIFLDCFNNVNVIGKDSVFLLQFKNNKILILFSFDKHLFMSTIGRFIFETTKYIIVKQQVSKYFVKYLAYNKNDKTLINVININELPKERESYQYIQWLKKNGFKGDITARLRFEKEIMNPPSNQPLIKLKDSIYFMEYSRNQIEIFNDNLQKIETIDAKYNFDKEWKPIFITDYFQKKIYTIYESSVFRVANINLRTGEINYKKEIPVLFPINPQINNGYFYCIKYNHIHNKKELFRIKLNFNE